MLSVPSARVSPSPCKQRSPLLSKGLRAERQKIPMAETVLWWVLRGMLWGALGCSGMHWDAGGCLERGAHGQGCAVVLAWAVTSSASNAKRAGFSPSLCCASNRGI